MSSTGPEDVRDRILRLEEHASFREREIEEFNSALVDLSARLERAIKRLEAIESRLGRLESPPDASPQDPATDRPPHY
ncbi:MAG: SlyX family protein [Phycisphaeraceae bacterium]|nr:SlyX family protein [Phycisphaeraceae bacterium]